MKDIEDIIKQMKSLDTEPMISKSESGELIIYTGLVRSRTYIYKVATPQQMQRTNIKEN